MFRLSCLLNIFACKGNIFMILYVNKNDFFVKVLDNKIFNEILIIH